MGLLRLGAKVPTEDHAQLVFLPLTENYRSRSCNECGYGRPAGAAVFLPSRLWRPRYCLWIRSLCKSTVLSRFRLETQEFWVSIPFRSHPVKSAKSLLLRYIESQIDLAIPGLVYAWIFSQWSYELI